MKYNFLESNLGPDFCPDTLEEVKKLVISSVDFTLVTMPGLGATTFFKYLTTTNFANFIYLNLLNLPVISKLELFKLLLQELGGDPTELSLENIIFQCEEKVRELAQKEEKIVILLTHFYVLGENLDNELFAILNRLRKAYPVKVSLIFQSHKPLIEILPQDTSQHNLSMISKIIFLKPYSLEDLKKIKKNIAYDNSLPPTLIEKALSLSGGHLLLLRLLLKSDNLSDPLKDKYIVAQLKELYQYLNYQDKKTLEKIALDKEVTDVSDYLLNSGLVQKIERKYQLFTPLLKNFLNTSKPLKLAKNEAQLFKLLKKNLGRVVSKDEIFEFVWGDDNDVSDWALNSIIYRLRKNPAFISQGYIIESHKKLGYSLIKN